MVQRKEIILRNIALPIWMIIWFPTWLWLLVIPLNLVIDFLVLYLSLRGMEDRGGFCRSNIIEICIAGFAADFLGAVWMLIVWFFYPNRPIGIALANNPFSYLPALILVLLCTAFSAFLIYVFDKRILIKTGKLDDAQVRRSSLIMALCTAPYMFLLPASAFSSFY